MNQEDNNGLKPINASLIPGVSINKRTLKVSKARAQTIVSIQAGTSRSDEHNSRALALQAKINKVRENFKARGLKFSVNEFALGAIEKEIENLGAYIGFDSNPKA